jgi:type I restriction enzyme M protein
MIAISSNFFYTVTLPCTLWFLDRGKRMVMNHHAENAKPAKAGSSLGGVWGRDTVLFIDARNIYTQMDRAHREFAPEQVELLANIVRLYRGEEPETASGSAALTKEHFPRGKYADVLGLCKVATLKEIEAQGWSLNPGRYVGVAEREADDFDFAERLEELNEELETLNVEARELEERIAENVKTLLAGGRE